MARKALQYITIPPKLKEWLREYAAENNTSMSMVITKQLRRLKRREELKKSENELALMAADPDIQRELNELYA